MSLTVVVAAGGHATRPARLVKEPGRLGRVFFLVWPQNNGQPFRRPCSRPRDVTRRLRLRPGEPPTASQGGELALEWVSGQALAAGLIRTTGG